MVKKFIFLPMSVPTTSFSAAGAGGGFHQKVIEQKRELRGRQ